MAGVRGTANVLIRNALTTALSVRSFPLGVSPTPGPFFHPRCYLWRLASPAILPFISSHRRQILQDHTDWRAGDPRTTPNVWLVEVLMWGVVWYGTANWLEMAQQRMGMLKKELNSRADKAWGLVSQGWILLNLLVDVFFWNHILTSTVSGVTYCHKINEAISRSLNNLKLQLHSKFFH